MKKFEGPAQLMPLPHVAERKITIDVTKERLRILRKLDCAELVDFLAKCNVPLAPCSDESKLSLMHYSRLQYPRDGSEDAPLSLTSITNVERLASAKWLILHGRTLPSGYVLEGDTLIFNKPNDPDGQKPNFGMDGNLI